VFGRWRRHTPIDLQCMSVLSGIGIEPRLEAGLLAARTCCGSGVAVTFLKLFSMEISRCVVYSFQLCWQSLWSPRAQPTLTRSVYLVFVKLMLAMHASQFVVQKKSLLAAAKLLLSPFAVQKWLIAATEQLAADASKASSLV
jgi:hypothetical protein